MLEDLLTRDLLLVVCGSAVGRRSAEVGHYYAGRGNKFWRTLHVTGLTDSLLQPSDFRRLLFFGIGLTDLVKGQAGADSEVKFSSAGRDELRRKVLEYQPKVLCFNGKRTAKEFFGQAHVEFGLHPERISSTLIFVAPSTSGAANAAWDVSVWEKLAEMTR